MRCFCRRTQFLLFFAGSVFVSACGSNITPKQLDEPCTRTSQCDTGLVCLTGVCQLDPDGDSGGGGS